VDQSGDGEATSAYNASLTLFSTVMEAQPSASIAPPFDFGTWLAGSDDRNKAAIAKLDKITSPSSGHSKITADDASDSDLPSAGNNQDSAGDEPIRSVVMLGEDGSSQALTKSQPLASNGFMTQLCRGMGRFMDGQLGVCNEHDRLSTAVAFDMDNTCILQGHLVKPMDSTPEHDSFLHEYGRISIIPKPGGFSCLPWATIVFNVATSPGQRPTRIQLRPDGAVYWMSEKLEVDGPAMPPPEFISVSGLTYIPRAPWSYGTTGNDCMPMSRPHGAESPRQSHVKSCLSQVEIKVPLGGGEEQIIQARCRLYKRLICQRDPDQEGATSCLQQKEGSCKDARIYPSVTWSPAQCDVSYCANILATL